MALLLWVELKPLLETEQRQEQEQVQELEQQDLKMHRILNQGRKGKMVKLPTTLNKSLWDKTLHFHLIWFSKRPADMQQKVKQASQHRHPWSVHQLKSRRALRWRVRLVALFRRGGGEQWCGKDKAASLTCHNVSSRSRFGQRRRPSWNSRKI